MQDQDNITQISKESDEIKETSRETPDALNVQPTTTETPILEIPADELVQEQNAQEIPSVEFIGNQEETPTIDLNAQEIPTTENTEFQTAQVVEIADAPKVEAKEEELFMFNGYELKTWEFNPRIYKILTGSTIFCILALVAVGQSNVLNTKACDSPLVSKVCQVLDTVYVGSVLLGNDKDWVEKDFDPTNLDDAEIIYVDMSNISPPLPYPQGYFAFANPEMMYNDPMIIPGSDFPTTDGFPTATNNFPPATKNFPSASSPNSGFPTIKSPNPIGGKNPITAKANLPKTPGAIKGTPPDSGMVIGDGDENPIAEEKRKPGKNQGFPTGENNNDGEKEDTAKNKDKQPNIKSDPVDDSKINKKPLKDFAKAILDLRAKQNGNLDLSRNFIVELDATLSDEGKFIKDKSKYLPSTKGNEEMINIAKDAIEAIGDSKLFGYLKELKVNKVNFTIMQNDEELYVTIKSSQPNEESANTISKGLVGLIFIAKQNAKKDEDDELFKILDVAKSRVEGKNFVLDVRLDKNTAQAMINARLKEEAEKAAKEEMEKGKQSNSAAQTENGNSKVGK